jgi:hypothetical protein
MDRLGNGGGNTLEKALLELSHWQNTDEVGRLSKWREPSDDYRLDSFLEDRRLRLHVLHAQKQRPSCSVANTEPMHEA